MTCQVIAQSRPNSFTGPGILQTIPLMPEGTCAASSTLPVTRYPGLGYQEGILVMRVGRELRTSVRHAWNVGPAGEVIDTTNRPMTVWPGQEVTYSYIPDGPEHEAERRALVAEIGEPVPFDEDPTEQEKGGKLAREWLETDHRGLANQAFR